MYPIQVENLTKRFRRTTAVEDLSFHVRAGAVTGFLGRNGAGKTTTLRMILGLAHPTSGTAVINGQPYEQLANPTKTIGVTLETCGFHPGRTGRNHLLWVAAMTKVPTDRVDQVLALVGMTDAANRRVKGYSLGMRQRLAIATALLNNPEILILDEPANGLDPQGIRWLRDLLRFQADEGKTVLVSSHLLAEVAQMADDVIVVDRGRLIRQGAVEELTAGGSAVRVKTPAVTLLAEALQRGGGSVSDLQAESLSVQGLTLAQVGEIALSAGVSVHGLEEDKESLEDVFLRLTGDAQKVAA